MILWRGWRRMWTRRDALAAPQQGTGDSVRVPPRATGEGTAVATAAARQREHDALCQLRRVEARLRALQAEADVLKGGR